MNKPRFDRNKAYNELPFLAPDVTIENNPLILKKLVTASRALATVNTNTMRLPNPFMLVNTIALQEARTSTEIENIFTTNDELYKAISDAKNEEKADPAIKEVLRYREAMWAGYHSLLENKTLNTNTIIKIFRKIKNTRAGIRPPQARVVIRKGSSEIKPGEIIYTPPVGDELLKKLLDNLFEYLNNNDKYPTDPLLKMCISHYQFEAIHPFQDGNGRTGRILNIIYLIQSGLLNQPTLYLSKYIILHKDEYYYTLAGVSQRGNWTAWLNFMLDAVEYTANITNQLISEIIDQMDASLDYGKKKIKWYNKEVNEAIFSQPYIKPAIIGNILEKTSRTTLTKYMEELVNANILTPRKDGVEVFYLNDNLIRILES